MVVITEIVSKGLYLDVCVCLCLYVCVHAQWYTEKMITLEICCLLPQTVLQII